MGAEYRLGVDLGTSFTAAAVWREGRAENVVLGSRSSVMPSVVFSEPGGGWAVGEAAERRGLVDPERVAREFKRRFGDPTPLLLGGSPFGVETVTSVLLGRVLEIVQSREGELPGEVTITHPANWGPYKRELLASAARLAGVEDPVLLSEPAAAARAHGAEHEVEQGASIAVYDLGAGTFDTAVLTYDGEGFRVLDGADGIDRLGGMDLDEAILSHVLAAVDSSSSELDDEVKTRELGRLRSDCTAAKEALSEDNDTIIPVHLGSVHTEVRLTRGEFEAMVGPTLEPSIDLLARTIDRAGLAPADLSAVLLVGGSSRIPLVSSLVGGRLGRPTSVDGHPKHVVALGAATPPLRARDQAELGGPATTEAAAAAGLAEQGRGSVSTPTPAPAHPSPALSADPTALDPHGPAPEQDLRAPTPPPWQPTPTATASPPPEQGPVSAPNFGRTASGSAPPDASDRRRRWRFRAIAVAVAAILVAVLIATLNIAGVFSTEIQAEPIQSSGANPFMPAIGSDQANVTAPSQMPSSQQPVAIAGNMSGIYGGTLNDASCDREAMIQFLAIHPAEGAAWASVEGISPADIPGFIRTLTPVLLRTDTAVTNHGFADGEATTVHSVLQAGTAVLVDTLGTPRSRCSCGNPLTPAARFSHERITGAVWPTFTPTRIVTIEQTTVVISVFVLVDPVTNTVFDRPAGTTGTQDQPTGAGSGTQTQPGPATGPSETPTTTSPAQTGGDLSQPVIAGTYDFTSTVTSCTGGFSTCGSTITKIAIECAGADCTIQALDGEWKQTHQLTQDGNTWEFTASEPTETPCGNQPEPNTITVQLSVASTYQDGGLLRAKTLSGTYSVSRPVEDGCTAAGDATFNVKATAT